MAQSLFLIFNHRFTDAQELNARASLGVTEIVYLPRDLKDIWNNIPSGSTEISDHLAPVRDWLNEASKQGDYVLVQGDFGACYLMVLFAMERHLIPIYSTTERRVVEEQQPDGSVKLTHEFKHRIFRRYGV
jgi:hypothetical protein